MTQRITLGKTDLSVSPICYGSWQLSPSFWGDQPEEDIVAAIHRAQELGVNFYDTADAYGDGLSERVVGKALSKFPRESYVLATKVFWHFYEDGRRHPDLSASYILEACDASLRRLGMDYIDLYQLHSYDPLVRPGEAAEALEKLRKQGKVRHYGVSNWNPEQMRFGLSQGLRIATLQPPYSLLKHDIERDILPFCQASGIGTLVYSPLHKGLLTGKYTGSETFDDLRKNIPDFQGERFRTICQRVQDIGAIGKEYGLSVVQTVLAATLMHPGIDVAIAGIKKPSHIEEAAGAMGKTMSIEHYHKIKSLLVV